MPALAPSWRAALRIARRDAWRNKGRNVLVALLVALPVAAVSLVDVTFRTQQLVGAERVAAVLGDHAQALVSDYSSSGGTVLQSPDGQQSSSQGDQTDASAEPPTRAEREKALAAALPARDTFARTDEWYSAPRLRVGDRSVALSWREVPLAGGALAGLFRTEEGRPPKAAGEVALTTGAARSTGLDVGDTVPVPDAARAAGAAGGSATLTVVGVVRDLTSGGSTVLGAPGLLLPEDVAGDELSTQLYVVGPTPVTWDDVLRWNDIGAMVVSRSVLLDPPPADRVPFSTQADDYSGGTSGTTTVAAVGVSIALALLQIALLAGPALAVGARRNQRMLAVVISTGGERKHARRVVLANGLVVGVVASAVAAVVGATAGIALCAWLIAHEQLLAPGPDVGWLDLLGLVAVGGLTAVAAALVPARQAARLDVVAALTGRRAPDGMRRHVPIAGGVLLAIGLGLTVFGAVQHVVLAVIAGLGLAQVGLVATSGAAVALAARTARRFSLAPRMALRDAARQRGRSAPAVAAVMAAIAGGLAAVLFVAAQDGHDRAQYTPQAAPGVVRVTVQTDDGAARPARELAQIEGVVRQYLPVEDVSTLKVLTGTEQMYLNYTFETPPGNECPLPADRAPTAAEEALFQRDPRCSGPTGRFIYGQDLVDDTGDQLAALLGDVPDADRAALAAGKVLVGSPLSIWPDGTVRLTRFDDSGQKTGKTVPVPAAAATGDVRFGSTVVPSRYVTAFGGQVSAGDLVASTTRLPTQAEEERAQAALEDLSLETSGYVSLTVERGYVSDYGLGLLALLGASLTITLVGSLTAVGLARAESRADASTLAAVGASPGLRRRLAAAQAGVVVGLGTTLGTVGGVLAGWALVRLQMPASTIGGTNWTGVADDGGQWQFVIPWRYLAALLLGVPVVAVVLAFVTTRSRIELVRRPIF